MKKDIGEGDRLSLRRFAGLVATFSPDASGLAVMDSGSAVMGPPKTVSHSGSVLSGVSRPVRVSVVENDTREGERLSDDGCCEADGATGDDAGGVLTDLLGLYDGTGDGNSGGTKVSMVCSSCTALVELCTDRAGASNIWIFGRVMVASV